MAYLLLLLVLAALVYVGWRVARMSARRPRTRVIGPDDDPDFLRRITPRDDRPRS
ncbi:hypothetical protein FK535_07935 [Mycolicibacterium sp. 018/SC-01/001]|uniref:hypothetical protein n=1 Tax=Mycolicibacterium sp. 018/SC-01/001 TaxID=2592069 RepID=UPI0011810323|nr:hypothetical protein [Mycolicibacterium sp. 018/SC-01/001]TRW86376.1 hypothetical protein FK535_07935 [Mycolicibacterium sp. 018/SC-01/001]